MLSATVCGVLSLICLVGADTIPESQDRIIGGDYVAKEEVPYHVSLMEKKSHVCGGSILSEWIILTASHCLEDVDPNNHDLQIRAGSGLLDQGGVVKDVAAFKMHPMYDGGNMNFDCALLKLASKLVFSNTIQKIELVDERPADGTKGFVCGFGLVVNNGRDLSPKIKGTTLNVMSRESCQKTGYKNNIQESMFCAAAKGTDACEGDSGGPFVVGNPPKQYGIVSFGFDCGSDKYPGVYCDVIRVKNFIEKTMKTL